MIIDEFYARNALNLKIKIKGITENNLSGYIESIIKQASLLGIDSTNFAESKIDSENEIASVFFVQEEDVLIHTEERVASSYIQSNVGEYIVFDKMLADSFNEKDKYGCGDFEEDDEIPIYGISRKYLKDGNIVSKYRLDTFIVNKEPIEITLDSNDVEHEEEKK